MTTSLSLMDGVSYALSNFKQPLGSIIDKVQADMNKPGNGASLKPAILDAVQNENFVGMFQVKKPELGRRMTIGELCGSYKHESTLQFIDPNAVTKILYGPHGLVHKAGGGRAKYLMEDIEVGFVYDNINDISIGPIITSGRNRLLALQIILQCAGLVDGAIANLKIRVSVIQVNNMKEIQERIISANTGSRDFSRAEIRERMGASGCVQLLNRETIADTIAQAETEKVLQAALGAWIKGAAVASGLNTLTASQYSDAGNSLWNLLAKKNKPEGRSFYAWVCQQKRDRFLQIAHAAQDGLPVAVATAINNPKGGGMAPKLAAALAPVVANRCSLQA